MLTCTTAQFEGSDDQSTLDALLNVAADPGPEPHPPEDDCEMVRTSSGHAPGYQTMHRWTVSGAESSSSRPVKAA